MLSRGSIKTLHTLVVQAAAGGYGEKGAPYAAEFPSNMDKLVPVEILEYFWVLPKNTRIFGKK